MTNDYQNYNVLDEYAREEQICIIRIPGTGKEDARTYACEACKIDEEKGVPWLTLYNARLLVSFTESEPIAPVWSTEKISFGILNPKGIEFINHFSAE